MTVFFVGAGPGAADLLTLRAARVLAAAPVCVYAGALVPEEVLAHCPPGAELVDSQHLTLDEIEAVLARAHAREQDVARLHSGDPSLYSAVTEQAQRLRARGIPYEIVPGVPAYAAAAATIGRELTVPGVAQTVVLTRHARQATAMPAGEELDGLAAHGATLVLHLATQALDELAPRLAHHYGADCPAVVVARASWPDERVLTGTLATIARQVAQAGVRRTATILVGPALAGADADGACASHLYSAARERP
ncbi:precorrin-4 C(11)-methyltransferase [Conexibacter sp. W3-3-2]|uniref:Precorrin-4 C(11)-methyltransferase n=1 Tax=Paraconexibacter algicola TaxID=2133960 RepID=A0A2T4UNC6_9ACTN|nr:MULTISPECIES: precorrin-4 C(11)-methyltransferase [Solirubrobacterales]MTD45750.1 precorrin-4 C(11)-methyltransferase [Conexibacter sp. W3-3-2]PTL60742.1 precorrin-4 C(11)-methyltransferase [Paraconexibacter algicola]